MAESRRGSRATGNRGWQRVEEEAEQQETEGRRAEEEAEQDGTEREQKENRR